MIFPDPAMVMKAVLTITVRLAVATLKIGGYILVGTYEVMWYIIHNRRDRVGEAIGRFGQSTVDAFADIFKYK